MALQPHELKDLAQRLSLMMDALDHGITPEELRDQMRKFGVSESSVECWVECARICGFSAERRAETSSGESSLSQGYWAQGRFLVRLSLAAAGMTAQIIRFPKQLASSPPKSERQKRFDRMVELIVARAARKGSECTEEKARAALTQAILEVRK